LKLVLLVDYQELIYIYIYMLYASPGQDVDRDTPVDSETILGGPPVLQARG
jgi:hypothetical protein